MEGNLRHEMLVALSLARGRGGKLFRFAASQEEVSLGRLARFLEQQGLDREALTHRIENLSRFGHRLAFEEIHPAWLLEHLKGESSRVIHLVGHFLSKPKVGYLLSHLAPEEREPVAAQRPVPPEIIQLVQRSVERKVGMLPMFRPDGPFSFTHLACLKGEDLKTLFKEVGMEEAVRALSGVEPHLLRAFLSRFPHVQVEEIRRRLNTRGVTPQERTRAQQNILALSLEQTPPDRLFLEIGFSVFARSLGPTEWAWAEGLSQKFSVAEGYRLRRLIRERKGSKTKEEPGRKEEILTQLALLGRQGKIQRYWKDEREVESTEVLREV